MTLSTVPDRRAVAAPYAPALADDSNQLDNAGFLAAVRRAAAGLRAARVTTGDVVAIMLPDSIELLVSLFATWRSGATASLVDPLLTDSETSRRIAEAGAEILIAQRSLADTLSVRTVTSVRELCVAEPGATEAAPPSPEAPALITYGGGSKRTVLDHRHLEAMCRLVIEVFALTDTEHSLSIMPMWQMSGILVGALSPLVAGGRATVGGAVDPRTFLERIERTRPTYFSAVPSLYAALSELPGRIPRTISSVRFAICCAAPAGIELKTEFEDRYGIPIVNGYGLSQVIARAHSIGSPASA
ncbi:AMP-binding protein [Streptomyces gardneri]|uniref:AMP-binding protein n=1 Tax=Nocardia TaxID=1817 RepID=UPI00135C3138|nr:MULTISPECIES: AMP-binding protein [Nocardia]MBF6168856.1 AMP-binding protein [Streptomyces gardneri]